MLYIHAGKPLLIKMADKCNVNVSNLVQTIAQDPVFRETINSVLTATNQESCLFFWLKSRSAREHLTIQPVKHLLWSSSAKRTKGVNTLTISAKKASPQIFDWIPNTTLIGGILNVECR